MTCTLLPLLPLLQCWDQGGPCGLQPPVWVSDHREVYSWHFVGGEALHCLDKGGQLTSSFAQQVHHPILDSATFRLPAPCNSCLSLNFQPACMHDPCACCWRLHP